MTGTRRPSTLDIQQHLSRCDTVFVPPLSSRVSLSTYADKLHLHAILFSEWHADVLVGLLAAYHNPSESTLFISNLSIDPLFNRQGIATRLIRHCLQEARQRQAVSLTLEVGAQNQAALAFYQAQGFITQKSSSTTHFMKLETGVSA